ncbi:carbohydrate sulfotransferase 9-like isoform X2 [Penaeus chinensis]|uniref:carbohydrate sulfotransferase 9-like isoform X2 n=1 Tax=Penaeus chinensis TaxID=139456 RepID=UPI001FB713F9|nr:carbohydrate sulfotransferase 9-like isoform X2 [Penaeus chinensis]
MFAMPSRRLKFALFSLLIIFYVDRFFSNLRQLGDVPSLSMDAERAVIRQAVVSVEGNMEGGSSVIARGNGEQGGEFGNREGEEVGKEQGGRGDEEETESQGIKEDEQDNKAEVERSLKERKNKVHEYCKSYYVSENLRNTIQNNMFFLWNYKVSTCIIEKVGSMSWRRRICKLNHIKTNTHDPKRKRLLKKSHGVVLKHIASTSSIVTVRHPLTRLVSCYRDKFENGDHPPLHERHWRDFYMPTLFCNARFPSDLHLKVGLKEPLNPSKNYPMSVFIAIDKLLQPTFTFTEFLHNVVESYAENRVNRHWNTYTAMCSPCTVKYSYVTKLESLTREMDYIFPTVGLPKDLADVMDHSTSTDENKDEAYIRYYSTVPLTLKKKIYEIFKADFEMFDYEVPEMYWEEGTNVYV